MRCCTSPRLCFNPRARMGRDFTFYHHVNKKQSFNPRARMGRDPLLRYLVDVPVDVSTHAPAWGATHDIKWIGTEQKVSTHAPAWGATETWVRRRVALQVSTHAPAWGATNAARRVLKISRCFNPRARMGRDSDHPTHGPGEFVSTHAPAWGATKTMCAMIASVEFQPTRPHGARRRPSTTPPRLSSFNPRARMGRDCHRMRPRRHLLSVSTHAPAWGATHHIRRKPGEGIVSTHAPAWGATQRMGASEQDIEFQPTRPHGARLLIRQMANNQEQS